MLNYFHAFVLKWFNELVLAQGPRFAQTSEARQESLVYRVSPQRFKLGHCFFLLLQECCITPLHHVLSRLARFARNYKDVTFSLKKTAILKAVIKICGARKEVNANLCLDYICHDRRTIYLSTIFLTVFRYRRHE